MEGEYEPSPLQFAADQVAKYEASGGKDGGTLNGKPVIILTHIGRTTGRVRKTPLMRVEKDGHYAVVASLGGAPRNPTWYYNLKAAPDVTLQDGANVYELTARQVTGQEKAKWWKVAVEAWPDYANYQDRTDRQIPVLVLEPRQ